MLTQSEIPLFCTFIGLATPFTTWECNNQDVIPGLVIVCAMMKCSFQLSVCTVSSCGWALPSLLTHSCQCLQSLGKHLSITIRHGGVAILIHNSVQFTTHLKHPTIELLLVDLQVKPSKIVCGLCHRSPSSTQSDLETTLDELPPSCANSLMLMGDFNIDILSEDHQLSSLEDKFGLKQVISAPTRTTSTLIDHMYLSDKLSHSSCAMQPPLEGSDHNSILLSLSKPLPPPRKWCIIGFGCTNILTLILLTLACNVYPAIVSLQRTSTPSGINGITSLWLHAVSVSVHTIQSHQTKPQLTILVQLPKECSQENAQGCKTL